MVKYLLFELILYCITNNISVKSFRFKKKKGMITCSSFQIYLVEDLKHAEKRKHSRFAFADDPCVNVKVIVNRINTLHALDYFYDPVPVPYYRILETSVLVAVDRDMAV